jgi:hypothetical protein
METTRNKEVQKTFCSHSPSPLLFANTGKILPARQEDERLKREERKVAIVSVLADGGSWGRGDVACFNDSKKED